MKPEILEVCEVLPDTDKTIRLFLTKIGKSKFQVTAEFAQDEAALGDPKVFKSEQEAWDYFRRMVQNISDEE